MMVSIECLYMYNLDSCHARIPCGCQTEELFLSWIFNECVHPSLPHFLASSGTLESLGLKSYSRPTNAILFWWEKSHPSSCTGSAWKALRKRVFPLSVEWHLDTDHGTCSATAGFLWSIWNKTHVYLPFSGRTQGHASWPPKSGKQWCDSSFLGTLWMAPSSKVPRPSFWNDHPLGNLLSTRSR